MSDPNKPVGKAPVGAISDLARKASDVYGGSAEGNLEAKSLGDNGSASDVYAVYPPLGGSEYTK